MDNFSMYLLLSALYSADIPAQPSEKNWIAVHKSSQHGPILQQRRSAKTPEGICHACTDIIC
jgi:hypothetical protein